MNSVDPRNEILNISPYVGGESSIPGVQRTYKLSSNEGAFGMPPKAKQALEAVITNSYRYPDGDAADLKVAISQYWTVPVGQIICGAGSDDILYQLCLCYGGPGREIVMSAHGFAIYNIAGIYSGSRVIKVAERDLKPDLDAILAATSPATTVVFLANPNNPTGATISEAELRSFRDRLSPKILLVIDSAYAEYVGRPDYDPGIKLVEATNNTVMTRTFSKIFGLAGVRLGWCLAPTNVVSVLNRVRGTFNVSVLAQAAGIAALDDTDWIYRSYHHNILWRNWLSEKLAEMGIIVRRGEGNFILMDMATTARANAMDLFFRRSGIIVRKLGAYDLPHCLRITVGTAEECEMVVEGVSDFVKQSHA
jgi:histidinol-phosphate aminotransferase